MKLDKVERIGRDGEGWDIKAEKRPQEMSDSQEAEREGERRRMPL